MSWINRFADIYDTHDDILGISTGNGAVPLLPVAFTTQNAQIEVTIDGDGTFIRAEVVPGEDKVTIIPCTEDSSCKQNGRAPHPLFDKLRYLAGDFEDYGGKRDSADNKTYMEALEKWCGSAYSDEKVCAVLKYLKKRCLVKDLYAADVIVLDDENHFLEKWNGDKDNMPPIYKVMQGNESEAFVRFVVYGLSGDSKIWLDSRLYETYKNYYMSVFGQKGLCYVTGKITETANFHPSKIRNAGDKAKLISANDESGFTYRGRFTTKSDVVSVGYEISQKAHNALKWMVANRGVSVSGEVFLTFHTLEPKNPLFEKLTAFSEQDDFIAKPEEAPPVLDFELYTKSLREAIWGIQEGCTFNDKAVSMVIDAATTGRMSIVYYKETHESEFLDRIKDWHTTCVWYFYDGKRNTNVIRAPSQYEIINSAFGENVDDNFRKQAAYMLFLCIVEGKRVPRMFMDNLLSRASNPNAFETKQLWKWRLALAVACAVYKKSRITNDNKEGVKMQYDENCRDRSYLYGCLLAIADVLEETTYAKEKKNDSEDEKEDQKKGNRITNALRYMSAFSKRPYTVWAVIHEKLTAGYIAKHTSKERVYNSVNFQNIYALFEPGDYEKNQPLTPAYLAGYYNMKQKLYTKQEKEKAGAVSEPDLTVTDNK